MKEVEVDGLAFLFPEDGEVTKYDEWDFYTRRFQGIKDGTKAVDILCLSVDAAWLIEVKDYRSHERTKPSDLSDEVAGKVRDTLAGLAAASANAEDDLEKRTAKRAIRRGRWRVVLHLEQAEVTGSALWPRGIDNAVILQKLRRRLKTVDQEPIVCNFNSCPKDVPWEVG